MRPCILLALVLSFASAKDKPRKAYPEHGTVVAMRMDRITTGSGVRTNSQGKTRGGEVYSRQYPVYKVRTSAMDYELEGKVALHWRQVNFRIDKNKAIRRT